jgi:hypothetical protein
VIRIPLIFRLATDFIAVELNINQGNFLTFDVELISSFYYAIDNRKFGLILLMQSNDRINSHFLRDKLIISPSFASFAACHSHKKDLAKSLLFPSEECECIRKGFREIVC